MASDSFEQMFRAGLRLWGLFALLVSAMLVAVIVTVIVTVIRDDRQPQQRIGSIVVDDFERYDVRVKGITRIERLDGANCFRVWRSEEAVAEFCREHVRGIYYERRP